MKRIYIITGRTGVGKTTLCKKLKEYFNYQVLSFAEMGRQFANQNGYNRIRECHMAMELTEFKNKISDHILSIINEQMSINNVIIIDGLYIKSVAEKLKETYNCKTIYIKTDDISRYERISQKLSITIEQAKKENEIKERVKNEVGLDSLIEKADCIIDGNKSMDDVFEMTKQYIEKCNNNSCL